MPQFCEQIAHPRLLYREYLPVAWIHIHAVFHAQIPNPLKPSNGFSERKRIIISIGAYQRHAGVSDSSANMSKQKLWFLGNATKHRTWSRGLESHPLRLGLANTIHFPEDERRSTHVKGNMFLLFGVTPRFPIKPARVISQNVYIFAK